MYRCFIAFNRTSMELKPSYFGTAIEDFGTFNRTSMELKPALCLPCFRYATSFNRTSMELKLERGETRIRVGNF